MTKILGTHHVALIVSDYERSKQFYTDVLGFEIIAEHFRQERQSWKLDLALADGTQLELFTFPDRENRLSGAEPIGLRHLAFRVADVAEFKAKLEARDIQVEDVRIDPFTGKAFTFFKDPDGLPLEIYQS